MAASVLFETQGTLQTPVSPGPIRGTAARNITSIRRAAVGVTHGRIVAVGTRAQMRRQYPGAQRVDLGDRLLLPGLVDAHNHLPFAGARAFELALKIDGASYLQILAAGGGIHRTVAATRSMPLDALVALCRARMRDMLAGGTTTSEAKSGYGLTWPQEQKQLQAVARASGSPRLVPTLLGAHVPPKGTSAAVFANRVSTRMIPAASKRRLARFVDVFVEDGAFNSSQARLVAAAARRHGMLLKLHADEFTNGHGARLGVALGARSVDHLLRVDAAGIRALSTSDTAAVLLPLVHRASFESRGAPARRLLSAGAIVALGTDFNPNCHNPSMLDVIRAAVYDLRMHPQEALTAATANAAYAIAEASRAGSLIAGMRADMVAFDADDITDLVYRQGRPAVERVLVAGRTLLSR